MLEYSASYLNVPPSFEDDTSFFPDFYTRLGPCELQDPVWAKMNVLSAGANKKRKKSETKPQAQINKCNNEKRRREQENIYIEELAELISANFADMSSLSVKPDKCAILQETVNQIRSIKQRESAVQSSDPVQQGEVSSSRPSILSNEVFGPLLLEALEGFLFVVNGEGRVEQVTENVSTYIKFTKEEVLGKSIYNFIHLGDHARFSSHLLPMAIGWNHEPTNRSKSFTIRLLVKPPEDHDESVEQKQQRVSCYELMHVLCAPLADPVTVSDEDGSDGGPCLLCVASRISYRDKVTTGIEQFTTKLDTAGKIIGVDTSGVSNTYSPYINKDLMYRVLKDLVPLQEVNKLNSHLRETLSAGQSTSVCYRLQLSQEKFIQVQTKSKLFKTNSHSAAEADFIMATHSIIGESDSLGPSDPGGGSGNNSVGGPLMTSVVNGTRNGGSVGVGSDNSTTSSNNALLNTSTTSYATFNIDNDFMNFDMFPSSTWDLDSTNWTDPRPDSRQSVTPVSTPTPRPPSNPSYSPATTVAQSPLASFVTQPSPVPNPSTPANPYNNNFPFSPLSEQNYPLEEQKDTKANVLEEASNMIESNRLRNLLTKPPNSVDTANDSDNRNKNRILKGLLKQQDEDDDRNDHRSSPRTLMSRGPVPGPSELPNKSSVSSGRNNMLLELLNERSEDDELEARAGVKKKSELLEQLLKPERDENEDKKNDLQSPEDSLLRSLGFSGSPSSPGEQGRARKRPSDDRDDNPNKRLSDGSQVSSSGPSTGSKLCEKNKMLASLLAQQSPNNHQPIPHVPASVLSATPQEKLPKLTDVNIAKNINNRMLNASLQQPPSMINNNTRVTRMPGRPQTTSHLNAMLSPANNMQRTDGRLAQVSGGCYTSPATSSTDNNNSWLGNNNMQSSNDPLLSAILDQVMDIVPDDIMHLLDSVDQQPRTYQSSEMTETMAINIIQRSLMQCETVVKSPSSPISIAGTPPSYSTTISNQNSQARAFAPPPNYPQQGYKMNQRVAVRSNSNYPIAGNALSPQQVLIQQHRKLLEQENEKKRLLQQQRQQHLLIPSNAAAEMNPGIQNIDSLLNNTVAPNVSLQRSSSVPEPQLSPNYNQMNQANQRANNQQPYSPHSQLTSPIQQNFSQNTTGNYQQAAARLSPQSPYNQQLSPRQAYPQASTQNNTNWSQQARLSAQNPMLNAQLTRAPQQQRSINSPGTRHSPFAAEPFPPPTSPNSNFNQNYLRLQRANSTPTATTHLPGGLGSPRPYGRELHTHSYPTIPPSHHPMMYQHEAQYCYDQTGLIPNNGPDRGRAPPHLHAGVSGSGPTSEYVRQELRAVVGARTGSAQPQQNRQILTQQQQVSDLETLGLSFETEFYGGGSAR